MTLHTYNYRGYDIGTFFCESMGGGCEGEYIDPLRHPSAKSRGAFCAAYLREADGKNQLMKRLQS